VSNVSDDPETFIGGDLERGEKGSITSSPSGKLLLMGGRKMGRGGSKENTT